jgi:hypothetical protein
MFKTARRLAKENRKLAFFVLIDVLWCGFRYGAGYVDYLIFDFVRLSRKQRKTFVTRGINNEFIRKLNDRNSYYKFEDKSVFNEIFSEFVKRDWVKLKAGEEMPPFAHEYAISKPINAICGQGIEKVKVSEIVACDYDRIVEEVIKQHEAVGRLHPQSVNTLRFMTILGEGNPDEGGQARTGTVLLRAIRVGSGGSVVDNFNAGGMFTLLDESGTIVSDAVNKNAQMFDSHPDSGIVFKGYEIPFFAQAQEMIIAAAKVVPEIRYVSWDVAISPDGPVLIEGNHNPGYDLLQSKAYLVDNEYGRLEDFKRVIG